MAAEQRRRRRDGERGQVLVVFILIFTTCMLLAAIAVAVGQMLVRRHQAQMVVDAAAFSGAGSQARGMNTIARFNEKSLNLLRAIQISKVAPYVDSESTMSWRLLGWIYDDWAGEVLEDYQNIFDSINNVINAVNVIYSRSWPSGPRRAAESTIRENFSTDAQSIFTPEDLVSHGIVFDSLNPYNYTKLVTLTEREEYKIYGYVYAPNPKHKVSIICATDPEPITKAAACGLIGWAYAQTALYINAMRALDPIEYELGRFYDNPEGTDVRFAYYLKVSQAPVLFGQNFFPDLPDITVAAAAKPYGGYLGDEFESDWWLYDTPDGKDISLTYGAKLVPLSINEKVMLALLHGTVEERWAPWNIHH